MNHLAKRARSVQVKGDISGSAPAIRISARDPDYHLEPLPLPAPEFSPFCLQTPAGARVKLKGSLALFCKRHALNQYELERVVAHGADQHRSWRIYRSDCVAQVRHPAVIFVRQKGEKHYQAVQVFVRGEGETIERAVRRKLHLSTGTLRVQEYPLPGSDGVAKEVLWDMLENRLRSGQGSTEVGRLEVQLC